MCTLASFRGAQQCSLVGPASICPLASLSPSTSLNQVRPRPSLSHLSSLLPSLLFVALSCRMVSCACSLLVALVGLANSVLASHQLLIAQPAFFGDKNFQRWEMKAEAAAGCVSISRGRSVDSATDLPLRLSSQLLRLGQGGPPRPSSRSSSLLRLAVHLCSDGGLRFDNRSASLLVSWDRRVSALLRQIYRHASRLIVLLPLALVKVHPTLLWKRLIGSSGDCRSVAWDMASKG